MTNWDQLDCDVAKIMVLFGVGLYQKSGKNNMNSCFKKIITRNLVGDREKYRSRINRTEAEGQEKNGFYLAARDLILFFQTTLASDSDFSKLCCQIMSNLSCHRCQMMQTTSSRVFFFFLIIEE